MFYFLNTNTFHLKTYIANCRLQIELSLTPTLTVYMKKGIHVVTVMYLLQLLQKTIKFTVKPNNLITEVLLVTLLKQVLTCINLYGTHTITLGHLNNFSEHGELPCVPYHYEPL